MRRDAEKTSKPAQNMISLFRPKWESSRAANLHNCRRPTCFNPRSGRRCDSSITLADTSTPWRLGAQSPPPREPGEPATVCDPETIALQIPTARALKLMCRGSSRIR
mmetsp:Transcript_18982/g.28051  ORF Transcript_18982/g.28051 Transcript_18982/m.28051 type:complete len:107 (-) Transcript_18982:44-364(-)